MNMSKKKGSINPYLNNSNMNESTNPNLFNIGQNINRDLNNERFSTENTDMFNTSRMAFNNTMNNDNNISNRNPFCIPTNTNQDNSNIMIPSEIMHVNNSINIRPNTQNQNFQNQNNIINFQNPNYVININDSNINNNNNNINLAKNKNQYVSNPKTGYIPNYEKPLLIGLKNLGGRSYLNSVLQFIASIKLLANYFLDPKHQFNKKVEENKNFRLSFVIQRLCTHIYPLNGEGEIYKSDNVKQILGEKNIVYRDNKEKNPNDLICFLLNQLHEELSQDSCGNSIVSDYFNWSQIKSFKCVNCPNETIDFQNFFTFELNLNGYYKKDITIEDCLYSYENSSIKNSFCSRCKSYNCKINSKIDLSPKIFIFLLDINHPNNINFILEKKINIEKFIKQKDISPVNYELSGIVFFDFNKNKYNALCVSPIDNNWYLFDDENVNQFDIDNFINSYIKYKMYKFSILLYSSISNNDLIFN